MKFDIAGIEYEVVFKEFEETDDLYKFGDCDYTNQTIRINSKSNQDRQQQTIIHELMHAILFEAGYSDQSELEDLVNRSSIVLYQVLKNNDFSFLEH